MDVLALRAYVTPPACNGVATATMPGCHEAIQNSCLCNGLTALLRANLGDKKGFFYSTFFELSIGLERMLKQALILDYMSRNQSAPPDSKTVEGYGHKLRTLFDKIKAICASRSLTEFPQPPIL